MMKSMVVLAAGIALAGAAFAQSPAGSFTGNSATVRGGFTGPVTVVTVEQAKTMKENTEVTQRGTIEQHTGGEKNVFRDASGR